MQIITDDMIGGYVECLIHKEFVDGRIQKSGSRYFLCQNLEDGWLIKDRFGYKYSYCVGTGDESSLISNDVQIISIQRSNKK